MKNFLIGVKKGHALSQFPGARFHSYASGMWLYLVESARSVDELRATQGVAYVEEIG